MVANGIEDYKITAQVEPYFKNIGLGRKPNLTYNFYNHDLARYYPKKPELLVDTSKNGLTTYSLTVNEFNISGRNIGNDSKYFDVWVSQRPIPVITITAEKNPVSPKDTVSLTAHSDLSLIHISTII